MRLSRALRAVAARPLVALVAVATFALGLGVNAAIFSLTREVLLRPLPYRDADRLVQVFEVSRARGAGASAATPANYIAWRDRVDAFDATALFRRESFNVSSGASPVQVEGFRTSPTFFPMLGIAPALGRGFADEEATAGRDDVVLLSSGFWQRQFGGDPKIIGHTIDLDGRPCIVVGILPPSFRIFRVLNREIDVFRPFVLDPTEREQSMIVWARLRPGVALDTARAQIAAAYDALPVRDQGLSGDVSLLSTRFAAQSRPILLALQWAVGLVLLIACANIANLLLASAAGRRRELAVRQALGASAWQIVRDFAGETLLLTGGGAIVAIVLAQWIVALLNATVSFQDINRLQAFRVDGLVLAFTAGVALLMAVAFVLLPARAAAATDVVDALKDSTHGVTTGATNRRLRQVLVVGELALAIVLTASALALTRSVVALQTLPRGVRADGVMTAQASLNGPRYADTRRLVQAASTMIDRLTASPGIADAALVNYAPLSLIRVGVPVTIEGQPPPSSDRPWIARYFVTSPNYFRLAGIPMRAGRDFTASDVAASAGVAIASESFARRFWNNTEAIGRRLEPIFPRSTAFWIPRSTGGMRTIVGVVADVREDGLPDAAGYPQLYLPYAQNPTVVVTLMARTAGMRPESIAPAIRDAVRAADPGAPVSYEKSFEGVIEETFARPREMAWLVGAFAAFALLLSAIGVYGVMAHVTTARTREIGIRMALGARPLDIVSLIVGHALTLTAVGVAAGVVLAPMALRLLGGVLFGVGPFDPATLVIVSALLGTISIAAAAIPALRATRAAWKEFTCAA
jgi:putative ABC transport system permease protein